MTVWSRDAVSLGDVFEHDGLLYRVVGLIDSPVAVLTPLDERDGEEREHLVISSPQFAAFRKVMVHDVRTTYVEPMSVGEDRPC